MYHPCDFYSIIHTHAKRNRTVRNTYAHLRWGRKGQILH